MHQSERVSSTSGNDHLDNDNHRNNNEEDSDMDSWPEDTTSPNDSKRHIYIYSFIHTVGPKERHQGSSLAFIQSLTNIEALNLSKPFLHQVRINFHNSGLLPIRKL